jgi:hypothetical protein
MRELASALNVRVDEGLKVRTGELEVDDVLIVVEASVAYPCFKSELKVQPVDEVNRQGKPLLFRWHTHR